MASWIEFASLKQAVPLMSVLERYGIGGGLRRSGKDQWRGRCPLHGGEGRDAFHVNTRRQLFHCFSCGAGGTVRDLVAAIEHCGVREAACRLAAWWEFPAVDASGARTSCKQATVTEKSTLRPLRFRLHGIDGAHPYLVARGIATSTAAEFGIGFYAGPGLLSQRLVIPIHDEVGQLVAYCGRSLDGTEPRYKFPVGFAKSQVLFNLHRATLGGEAAVVIVEGFFDCLKVHQAGFGSVIALMGSAFYDRQCWLLRERFRDVMVMLDGDPAGRRGSAQIAARLAERCRVRVIELAAGVQPDQLSEPTIQEILAREGGKSKSY
jgi:DNA primase